MFYVELINSEEKPTLHILNFDDVWYKKLKRQRNLTEVPTLTVIKTLKIQYNPSS